jgi:dihydrofolate reductase
MRKLSVFNAVSLDGYFTDADGDMSWAYAGSDDPEWQTFVSGNAKGGGALLLGRVTYEMMASYWPTAAAKAAMPAVADGMNRMEKFVASRTMTSADWQNTTVLKGDLVGAVKKLKASPGPDIAILGSGTIVAQLSAAQLIDVYQVVVNPLALGGGRTMFDGLPEPLPLKVASSRQFRNGKVLLEYTPT